MTHTRANTDYLVTEYGVARLKGLTAWERAEALINIAHPDFREQLIADAEKDGPVAQEQQALIRCFLFCSYPPKIGLTNCVPV